MLIIKIHMKSGQYLNLMLQNLFYPSISGSFPLNTTALQMLSHKNTNPIQLHVKTWYLIIWDSELVGLSKTQSEVRDRLTSEELCVEPVCWLWAWSLCGQLLFNIHCSLGSCVSACGPSLHTCTTIHAHQLWTRQTYGVIISI